MSWGAESSTPAPLRLVPNVYAYNGEAAGVLPQTCPLPDLHGPMGIRSLKLQPSPPPGPWPPTLSILRSRIPCPNSRHPHSAPLYLQHISCPSVPLSGTAVPVAPGAARGRKARYAPGWRDATGQGQHWAPIYPFPCCQSPHCPSSCWAASMTAVAPALPVCPGLTPGICMELEQDW